MRSRCEERCRPSIARLRTVTVQGEDGRVVTLDVPTTATRFDQVKVGDVVTMTYYDRVSVRAKPVGEAAVNRVIEPTTTATPGRAPGRDSRSSARGDDDPDGRGPGHSLDDLLRAHREHLYTLRDRHGRSHRASRISRWAIAWM